MPLNTRATKAAILAIASSLSVGMPSAQAPSAHRVMLDEAHHNIMATASGGYRPLVHVLTEAGFDVTPNTLPFRPDRLATTDIVVVANPNGAGERAPMAERATSAFTDSEIDALEAWVRGGGGLLLVTDHYPTGVAAQRLGERFGVKLSGGWTDDPANRRELPGYGRVFGYLVFSLENGLLPDHPITRGSDEEEKIEGVSTMTGGSMEGPPGSVSLLRLSPTAVDWIPSSTARALSNTAPSNTVPSKTPQTQARDFNPCPSCDQVSAAGHSQGIAFGFGRGRLVIIGEMGALIDYSVPGMQNRQFALNIVRWLNREL
ncbi:MAG TPA: hypothetical protein VMS40_26290 [Vicinamibacterales bacterium]|nr:hypothetical protein [Vicinamibacterales bacterium]